MEQDSKGAGMKLFGMEVVECAAMRKGDIYLVTPASKEEIAKGEYKMFYGHKISVNPKKRGRIKNVKLEEK